ncbi:MAG: hypothetical protein ACRDQZ_11800 [Mycobacteriales bacterium]
MSAFGNLTPEQQMQLIEYRAKDLNLAAEEYLDRFDAVATWFDSLSVRDREMWLELAG